MQRCSVSENNWLSNSVYSPHKSCRGRSIRTGQTMKNVSLHLFLLFLQIFFASGEGSHVGDLIRTKSGKVFLRRSSKKVISPKKDAKEGGQLDSDQIKKYLSQKTKGFGGIGGTEWNRRNKGGKGFSEKLHPPR